MRGRIWALRGRDIYGKREYKQKREGARNKGHIRQNVGRAAKTKHKRDECIVVFCLNIQCRTMHILRLIYRRPGLYKQLALLAQ